MENTPLRVPLLDCSGLQLTVFPSQFCPKNIQNIYKILGIMTRAKLSPTIKILRFSGSLNGNTPIDQKYIKNRYKTYIYRKSMIKHNLVGVNPYVNSSHSQTAYKNCMHFVLYMSEF